MSFTIKKDSDVIVVDVEGQLIVGNRQELKQKVLDELERGGRSPESPGKSSRWTGKRVGLPVAGRR